MSRSVGGLIDRLTSLLAGEGLLSELLRGGIGSLAVKTLSTILAPAVAVVLARSLGPAGYGTYSYVLAIITVAAIVAKFGLPQLVIRETAKFESDKEWGYLRGVWRWANIATLALSFFVAVVGAGVAWGFSQRFSETELLTFAWGVVLIPLMSLGNLRGAALRGLGQVVAGQFPEFVLRRGLLILLVLGVVVARTSSELTAATAMAMHVLSATIAFAVGTRMLLSARPEELKRKPPPPAYKMRDWTSAAFPLALLAGVQMINKHADILLLGLFRSADDVGLYKVVVQAGLLVIFGLQAVNMVVAPHFARLHSMRDDERLQRVVTISSRASLGIAIPITLVLVIWGEEILGLVFGAEYRVGHVALAITAIGQLANSGMGSVGYLLNMTGHERKTVRGVAIAAGCNISLNLGLIPMMGIEGAALATAVTFGVWNLLLWRYAREALGVESSPFG